MVYFSIIMVVYFSITIYNKVEDTVSHPHLAAIKEELRQMISDEICSWTRIDTAPI